MNRFYFCVLALAFALLAACSSKPQPMSLEEAPAALREAFVKAQTFTKKTAETIAKQITGGDFVAASIQLQALLRNTTLTEQQRSVASRALVAVAVKLNENAGDAAAPAEPDSAPATAPTGSKDAEAEAAEAIREHYIRTK